MRGKVASILILCVLMMAIVCQVLAIPLCSQIDTGFCFPAEGCTVYIDWEGSCQEPSVQWRCVWVGGGDCHGGTGPWSDCACGGGGCDCLLEGAPITLADGSTRPIETIRQGDRVLAYDEVVSMASPAEVVRVHTPYTVSHYLVINGEIRLTENHPVLSRGKWVSAGELRIGGVLTSADGADTQIITIRQVAEMAKVYNIQVAGGTYIAHGIVVHNKEDCWNYTQTCPTCF